MAKLNSRTSISKALGSHPDRTENFEGGLAFTIEPKLRLYTRVASCLVSEPKFYKTINDEGSVDVNQDKEVIADIALVAQQDPEFILQLATYTRNVLNLRTISIVLLVEASLIPGCKPFIRKYTPQIIRRADELAESVAYLQRKIGHIGSKAKKGSMPAALKKGLADTFRHFNEYQFAKYNRKGFVKLKDVLKLVHPKPRNDEESALYKRIKEDTLVTPDTWEVVISTKGSTKEQWESIAPKMPYMAKLRNLRNFLEKDMDSKILGEVLKNLADPKAVKYSRQLPFRFFTAYRQIEKMGHAYGTKVLDTLESAMDTSVDNLQTLPGTTFIVADHSGSMSSPLSDKSEVTIRDIADVLLAVCHKTCESAITAAFGTHTEAATLSTRNGILGNVKILSKVEVGHSTDAWTAIQYLIDRKIKVDRIIVLSDMQCYNSVGYGGSNSLAHALKNYKSSISPDVKTYSIDLQGYGTAQFPSDESNTALLAGFSDRVFDFISAYEKTGSAAIEEIKKYKLVTKKEEEE